MLKAKKLWIMLLIFCLVISYAMVVAPETADAAAKIKWSKVYKGSYNSLSPYTLNWTGNVLDRGGFSLEDMAVTTDPDSADFVITQSGSIAAGGILKLKEGLEDYTDASISKFNSYESVAQGAVYLIILHDGTWAKLKIDTVVKSYMDYLSKVTFSFVIEEELIEDEPYSEDNDFGYKPGQFAEDVEQGLYDEDPFASPEYDLLHPGAEYTFEEGPITVMFDALDDQIYFDLYRSDNGGPYIPVSDFLLEEPEFVDNYAFAGHTYLYIFVAYDEYGVSEISLPLKVKVVAKGKQKTIVMKLGSTTATIDGKSVKLDVAPVAVDGRTLVPVRFISEALDAKVDWDGKTSKITITLGDKVIVLTLNSSIAYVNGTKVTLDVPAKAINGRTMVPVRFVSESLDQEVSFDSVTKEIIIKSKGTPTSSGPSESNSNQGTGSNSSPANTSEQDYIHALVGKWDMWIPSLDPRVPGASGGILTITENNKWQNIFNGSITKGNWEIDSSGRMVLLDYMFGWDWYVSETEYGIKITSPPAAFQEGRPAK